MCKAPPPPLSQSPQFGRSRSRPHPATLGLAAYNTLRRAVIDCVETILCLLEAALHRGHVSAVFSKPTLRSI
jgi:hypothetical protein